MKITRRKLLVGTGAAALAGCSAGDKSSASDGAPATDGPTTSSDTPDDPTGVDTVTSGGPTADTASTTDTSATAASGDTGVDSAETGDTGVGQPNILFIMLDQVRPDTVYDFGAANPANLRALMAKGTTYTRAYTPSPLCKPARASIQVGQYVHEHGVNRSHAGSADPAASYLHDIKAAGYRTALFGKAHLHSGETQHTDQYTALIEAFGVDDAFELLGPGQAVQQDSPYTDFLDAMTPKGETPKSERYRDYTRAYEYDSPPSDLPPTSIPTEEQLDYYLGVQAAEWLQKAPEPFCLQLSFPGPHPPFDATSEYVDAIDLAHPSMQATAGDRVSGPSSANLDDAYNHFPAPREASLYQAAVAAYLAKLHLVDDAIGMVLDVLASRGIDSNTWIVVCGDHGEQMGDQGLMAKKVFFEGAIKVPLIIVPPGGGKAEINDDQVNMVDIGHALQGMAGVHSDPWLPHHDEIISAWGDFVMLKTPDGKLVYDTNRGMSVEYYPDENDESANMINQAPPGEVSALEARLQKLVS